MQRELLPRIAVIEDDSDLREELLFFLQGKGYRSWGVDSAEKFWKRLHAWPADIVLVDIGLPGEDGFSVIEYLRRVGSFGLIILSARGTREDHARGLSLGADLYLVKPVGFSHLASCINSLWEQHQASDRAGDALAAKDNGSGWTLNPIERALVAPDGDALDLTHQEACLLGILLQHPQEVLAREALHSKMFEHDDEPNSHRIDVILSRLRKKARAQNFDLPIRSIFGHGLAFVGEVGKNS